MPHATYTAFEEGQLGAAPAETPAFVPSSPIQIPSSEKATAGEGGQDVGAQLHYLTSSVHYTETRPPIQVVTREATHSDPRTTVKLSQGPMERIKDVRGCEHHFTLERNGFTFVKHSSQVGDWECRDKIWTDYVEKECKELVSNVFGGLEGGVDEVIAFHEGVSTDNCERPVLEIKTCRITLLTVGSPAEARKQQGVAAIVRRSKNESFRTSSPRW